MSKLGVMTANLAWMAACYPAHRRLHHALANPQEPQKRVLQNILSRNAASTWGRAHGFSQIRSHHDFQRAVPVGSYDDLSPYVDRIRAGEKEVLTTEPVRLFEKTSGSSSAAKYIPYTDSLRAEFQRAVRAWIFDLYRHDPALLFGRSYWLITPLSREREVTPGGLSVGFDHDAEYLGALERKIAEKLFAVPGELAQVADIEASLYLTLRFLLQADDLALISIWNPSYLTILMGRLDSWAESLLQDLQQGTATPPGFPGDTLPAALAGKLRAQPKRAGHLRKILESKSRLRAMDLWPRLRLISCWTHAAANHGLRSLKELFPHVRIQGKGLLATEGIVTVPWIDADGCIPALESHFYEFIPESGGEPKLVHELELNAEYSVLLTTGGGLYRYRLGDLVRVRQFHDRSPVLEFVGRDDGVSDLRGEKLSPAFVQTCIDQALVEVGATARFAMLAPQHRVTPGYALFIESPLNPERIETCLEKQLMANPHYAYCRNLGQLAPLQIFWIADRAQEAYVRRCAELGQRLGSIKPSSLHRSGGWEDFFNGRFVTARQPEVSSC